MMERIFRYIGAGVAGGLTIIIVILVWKVLVLVWSL